MHYGILSLLPPILTLFLALYVKDIMVALFVGTMACSIIVNGANFLIPVIETYVYQGVSGNLDMIVYSIIFGGFLAAIKKAGGFAAFSNFAERHFNSPKKSKFITWLLSLCMFNIQLGTIGVGNVMRPIMDRHRISREKQGYILSTTAEASCALMPITIFILYFGGLITTIVPELDGKVEFIKSIPFNIFAILCLIVGLLTALEIIPDFGYMKTCEQRAKTTGQVIRPGSRPMDTAELDEMQVVEGQEPDILAFILPFAAFFATIILLFITTGRFVLVTSILIGFFVSVGYPILRGYFKVTEVIPLLINGAKSMLPVCLVLGLAFGFGNAVGEVGFANFVVEITQPLLSPLVLPAVVFLVCAVSAYATGSLVSACAILGPIAITLAYGLNANLTLTIGALVGGSMFGDNSSPLSDTVIESAMGAGVDVVDLGKAQMLPRVLLGLLTAAIYLVIGVAFGR